jgi:hypothetical protein
MKNFNRQEKSDISQIIDEGLYMEDWFTRTYSIILKNAKFLDSLDANKSKKVKENLDILIQETKKHQDFLLRIKKNLNI